MKLKIGGILCGGILFLALTSFGVAAKKNLAQQPLPAKDVKQFVTAIAIIKHYYVKPVKESTLFRHAINGMVSKLDPHSEYLSAEDINEMKIMNEGQFSGIGVEIIPLNGSLKVISPIDGSPAKRAGIKSGDVIIKVNNRLIQNLDLQDAINLIRGKRGTMVKLLVLRKNKKDPIELRVKRGVIKVDSVKYRLLNPGYAYIRIATFNSPLRQALSSAVVQLKKTSKVPLKGLVLDLRNNPGGLLNAAIDASNIFLRPSDMKYYRGLVVYTKGRTAGSDLKFKAKPMAKLASVPIVVLINNGSASASEIVAGALQDYHRALVMGTQSFGKGSVQTVIPMGKHSAIKLTTSLYYTPAGRSIQAQGIAPDVVIPAFVLKDEDASQKHLKIDERQLSSHIKSLQNPRTPQALAEALLQKNQALAQKDYQLYQALMMLYAMHRIHRPVGAHP